MPCRAALLAVFAWVLIAPPAAAQVAPPVQALLDDAKSLDANGKTGEATGRIEAAVTLAERTAPESESHAAALSMLAEFLAGFDVPRALAAAERSAAIRARLHGPDDMRTLGQLQVVALIKGIGGDKAGQLAMMGDVLQRMQRAARTAEEREQVGVGHAAYAMTLVQSGDEDAARRAVDAALALFDGPPRSTSASAFDAYHIIAGMDLRWGRFAAAVDHSDAALAAGRRHKGDRHPDLLLPTRYRAEGLLRSGRLLEAEQAYVDAIAIADGAQPPIPSLQFNVVKALGQFYLITGRTDLAIPVFERAVATTDRLEPSSSLRITAHADLAQALWLSGDRDAAAAHWLRGLDRARSIEPNGANVAAIALQLAGAKLHSGSLDEAEPLIGEASRAMDTLYPAADAPERASLLHAQAQLAEARGGAVEAGQLYRQAVALAESHALVRDQWIGAGSRGGLALARTGDAETGWRLARAAHDGLTQDLVRRSAAVSRAAISADDIALFEGGLDVAWIAARPVEKRLRR